MLTFEKRLTEEGAPAGRSRKVSCSASPADHAGASIQYSRGRARLLKILRVLLRECRHIFRHVSFGVDRIGGANRNAGAAIDAIYRVNVELLDFGELGFVATGMNAVNGTNLDALFVLCATFNNDERHEFILL
jgi:hypothetical protein